MSLKKIPLRTILKYLSMILAVLAGSEVMSSCVGKIM